MGGYSLSDFEPRADKEFAVDGGDGVMLRLAAIVRLSHSNREGGGFRLDLQGPADPVLDQGIYTLRDGDDTFEIFLVPVSRNPDGRIGYEAIFN